MALLGALLCGHDGRGSRAYGNWASTKLKSKRSAQLATSFLGMLIFIDDYFNCLTVGTVMKPVTDKYNVSRAKLAYIIDATAAPVCIIAPISSWAAAVGSTLYETGAFTNELQAFFATIPYNLYAILSIIMVLALAATNLEFGPMAKEEYKAEKKGDLGAVADDLESNQEVSDKGTVWDLIIPHRRADRVLNHFHAVERRLLGRRRPEHRRSLWELRRFRGPGTGRLLGARCNLPAVYSEKACEL